MADYKDIITGTIGSIVGKVKEAADSGAFKDIYEQGSTRAKSFGRIAKLSLEMNGDSEELKRVYTEIGKLYYEQAKDAPEGFFAPLFAQAAEISQRLNAKADEIAAMKEEYEARHEPDIQVDVEEFEDIISADEDSNKGQ